MTLQPNTRATFHLFHGKQDLQICFILNLLPLTTVKSSECCDYNLESDLPLTVGGTDPQYLSETQQGFLSLSLSLGTSRDKLGSICDHVQFHLSPSITCFM